MPQKRKKENRGLPARWRFLHGAYYYKVPEGQEGQWDGKKLFRLGKALPEAYSVWAERMAPTSDVKDGIRTIGQLLDRYALEVIPLKALRSQANNRNQLPALRRVFNDYPLVPFEPQLVYQYVTRRSVKSRNPLTGRMTGGTTIAHREIELLSHAYTKAVEWGLISSHPFRQEVRLKGEAPRDRYIEDWEVEEMLSLPSFRRKGSVKMVQSYLRLKLLTGVSQFDLLSLTESDLKEDGIHVQRHKTRKKTGKRTIYEWSDELRDAVQRVKRARPVHISRFLFCNGKGDSYINPQTEEAPGWKSVWQRFVERVLTETKVRERFTEHDFRAKVASDATSLEHARQLLAHADARTTDRIYRRRAEVVKTGSQKS